MRTPLGTLVIRYRTSLGACQRPFAVGGALALAAMSAVLPVGAAAQRADGAIGVALVIAPRVEIRQAAIAELRVDRGVIATTRTVSQPTAAASLPLVTSRVSRSTTWSAGHRNERADACDQPRSEHERSLEYRIHDGGLAHGGDPLDVRLLRSELVVVAGT